MVRQVATDPAFAQLPPIIVQFGIHTGELLVGNITLTSRVDYTVAGENLSIAYRVADLNDIYGTEIVITDSTQQRCDAVMDTRELDQVRIKGRRDPTRAFELISLKGQAPSARVELLGTFLTGLSAFRNRDYAAALAMFRECRNRSPEDGPTSVYIDRCERELTKIHATRSES